MSSRLIIIGGICAQDPAQVCFTEHDHMVETFPADRANKSLNVSIFPGRSRCGRTVPNAHGAQPLHEEQSVRAIPIPNEISRSLVPWERLGDLAFDPLRGSVGLPAKRHPQPLST